MIADEFVLLYSEDLLFFERYKRSNHPHLESVLPRTQEVELCASPIKCGLFKEKISFYGIPQWRNLHEAESKQGKDNKFMV